MGVAAGLCIRLDGDYKVPLLCFGASALQPIAIRTDARDVTFPSQTLNKHPFVPSYFI